jgi:plasmid replication initiation protein
MENIAMAQAEAPRFSQATTTGSMLYGQGNELIDAIYSMPLNSKRLLLLGLSKVWYSDPDKSTDPNDPRFKFDVSVQEWESLFGKIEGGSGYWNLDAAAKQLMRNGGLIILKQGMIEKRIFDECRYLFKEGKVRMCFSVAIRDHLVNLIHGDYTPVDLMAVRDIQSVYAIRIYEMCRQFRKTGWREISVHEFRKTMVLEHRYPKFNDLKRRIIEFSIDQIVEHIPEMKGLSCEYLKKEDKRRVTHLRFTFPKDLD